MSTLFYRETESSLYQGAIVNVEREKLTLQFYGEGNQPGESVSPHLKGHKISAGQPRTFHLHELRKLNDWADHSIWIFPLEFNSLKVTEPVNLLAETSINKMDADRWIKANEKFIVFRFLVPSAKSHFLQMPMAAMIAKGAKLVANMPTEKLNSDNPKAFSELRTGVFPTLKLKGPSTTQANSVSEFSVQAETHDGKIFSDELECFIEATGGYLPKTRIPLVKGQGKFKLQALLLEAGDEVHVKVGFRYFRNVQTHVLQIS